MDSGAQTKKLRTAIGAISNKLTYFKKIVSNFFQIRDWSYVPVVLLVFIPIGISFAVLDRYTWAVASLVNSTNSGQRYVIVENVGHIDHDLLIKQLLSHDPAIVIEEELRKPIEHHLAADYYVTYSVFDAKNGFRRLKSFFKVSPRVGVDSVVMVFNGDVTLPGLFYQNLPHLVESQSGLSWQVGKAFSNNTEAGTALKENIKLSNVISVTPEEIPKIHHLLPGAIVIISNTEGFGAATRIGRTVLTDTKALILQIESSKLGGLRRIPDTLTLFVVIMIFVVMLRSRPKRLIFRCFALTVFLFSLEVVAYAYWGIVAYVWPAIPLGWIYAAYIALEKREIQSPYCGFPRLSTQQLEGVRSSDVFMAQDVAQRHLSFDEKSNIFPTKRFREKVSSLFKTDKIYEVVPGAFVWFAKPKDDLGMSLTSLEQEIGRHNYKSGERRLNLELRRAEFNIDGSQRLEDVIKDMLIEFSIHAGMEADRKQRDKAVIALESIAEGISVPCRVIPRINGQNRALDGVALYAGRFDEATNEQKIIPKVANELGLDWALGNYLLETAISKVVQSICETDVSISIPWKLAVKAKFYEELTQRAKVVGYNVGFINLEIAIEAGSHTAGLLHAIARIRELGYRVSICVQKLENLPTVWIGNRHIDTIVVGSPDRGWLSLEDNAYLQTTADLIQSSGKRLVALSVQTDAEYQFLKASGIHIVEGIIPGQDMGSFSLDAITKNMDVLAMDSVSKLKH